MKVELETGIEEKIEGLVLEDEGVEENKDELRWCLVVRLLIEKIINFNAMHNTLAALWRPLNVVSIKEIISLSGSNMQCYLLQFYHEVSVQRMLYGDPWIFDNNHLVLKRLHEEE